MVPLSDTDQHTGTEGGGWRMSGPKGQPNQLRYAREWRKVAQEGGACQVKKVNITNYDTRESGTRWRKKVARGESGACLY